MRSWILLISVIVGSYILPTTVWPARSENLFQNLNRQYFEYDSKKNTSEKQWLRLIQRLEHIQNNLPTHPDAPITLLHVGKVYRKLFYVTQNSHYLDRSLRTLRLLIKTYPNSIFQDDSQFIIGKIFEDKKELPLALLEYHKALNMHDGDQKTLIVEKIKRLQKRKIPLLIRPALKKPLKAVSIFEKRQGGLSIDKSRKLPKSQISSVRYWATDQWAKIVINTSRPIPYLYGELLTGNRSTTKHKYYVDLIDSQSIAESHPASAVSSLRDISFIHDVHLQSLNSRITRLTFTLEGLHKLRVYDYKLSQQNVITLEISTPAPNQAPLEMAFRGATSQPLISTSSKPKGRSPVQRIVIDPGHGGIDPGAGGFGIYEKDVVLAIGKELQTVLENKLNLKVFLTRTSDEFITLEERAAFARQNQGDLFISLHANAHLQSDVHGIESYYLDVSDNQTSRKLAIRENKMTHRGLQDFNAILHDLLSLSHYSQSIRLTQAVHKQLIHNIHQSYKKKPRDLGIKAGPFLVLLGVDMPSTLIEISFVTNFEENQRLKDPHYHRIVARGITEGIQNYIQ